MPSAVTLHNADCTKALPVEALVEGMFDVLIGDLPYSEHCHTSAVSCAPGKGVTKRDFDFDPLDDPLRDYVATLASMVVKRWSVLYSDVESAEDLMRACEAAGAERIRHLPWVRWSMPQLSADRPVSGFELLPLLHRQYVGPRGGRKPVSKAWNGPGWLTHLEHIALRGDDKHPTEKPLDQALDLVAWFTEPGEHIVDPCAGVATVGLAAAILGRQYTGFELLEEHHATGTERLRRWQLDRKLNDRDAERFDRWKSSQHGRSVKGYGILERELRKPKPSIVQTVRMLGAIQRDLAIAVA